MKNLINLFFILALILPVTVYAKDLKTGEYAVQSDGSPAFIGQTVKDHIFVRNDNSDEGTTQDNVLSFKSGSIQVVEFWLDDDEIYTNALVQALPPVPCFVGSSELYKEITYCSSQMNIYLPMQMRLVNYKFPGETRAKSFQKGDRMPYDANLDWLENDETKIIDGIEYRVYTLIITNTHNDACHFSGDEDAYAANGNEALRKNDACLFRLAIQNDNQDEIEGRLPDMIIANQEFAIREAYLYFMFDDGEPDINNQRYIYGTGGNNIEQRFQLYNRVALYGSNGINDETIMATSISLNETNVELTEGETIKLTATIQPTNVTNKSVRWNTSNSAIATVNSLGLVTARSVGSATITATTTDGSNLSATCVVTVTKDLSNYDNYLSMEDISVFHGETIVIPVKMTNEADIISFQTDIFLPEGLELMQEDGEYLIDPSDRMTRTHNIMSNDVSNGAVRVVCYSSNYKPFTGNSGDDLFYLTVKVADDASGDYPVQLKNTLFTTSDFEELTAPDVAANVNVKAYLLGDANNSGNVTVTDVVVTSQYVLEMNPQPFIFEAADVNFDGNITVTDVSRIAWMVLNPTMNAPLRAPGQWNNGDRMNGNDITLALGETRKVSIVLDNEMDYAAFQLDLKLPVGLKASNFQLTDRAGSHAFDVNTLLNGNIRALCYSPAMAAIDGREGVLLTFDVTATGDVQGDITVDGIELVTTACQTVLLDAFAIGVNNATAVNELAAGKAVAKVEYFNLAGQQIDRPDSGVTLVVTTYTDGIRSTTKLIQR